MEEARRVEEGFGHTLTPVSKKEDDDKAYMSEKVDRSDGGDCIDHEKGDRRAVVDDQPTEQKEEEQPLVKQKSKRVATLDAFRGLTIVLMVLVDDAGGVYPRIDHSPWNGCTLADFVMPFFLFIVGVAIALALKKVPNIKHAIKKIFMRTLKLLFWGILLQGGYSHAPDDLSYGIDIKNKIRWCGILQRIALAYFVVALIETLTTKLRPTVLDSGHLSIFPAYRWQWIGGFIAFLIYMITTFALYVPDWSFALPDNDQRYTSFPPNWVGGTSFNPIYKNDKCSFVKCGMRGHLGPACNAVGYVDRQVWGINHLYSQPVWIRLKVCKLGKDAPSWCLAPFEPEGLLSSISAILSATIGIHYGHVLLHFKGHSERLKQWVSMGFVLLVLAIILHFTDAVPMNKQLYSFSYVCFTAGAAGIVFSGFYLLIDVWGLRKPFLFLEWIGMNAMLVFVMAAQGIFAAFVNGWFYETQDKTLVHWIQQHVFINVWHSERVGTLLYVIFAEITFWAVVAGILHKLGIYWKL